jgi:hypothetical protein
MDRILARIILFAALPVAAQSPQNVVDQLLDRIIERERAFLESIQKRTPLIETYIQETQEQEAEDRLTRDHYFLGRFRLTDSVNYESFIERTDLPPRQKSSWLPFRSSPVTTRSVTFLPRGFVQMTVLDLRDFNRQSYKFEYVRREFLGEVRCLVFDVVPVNPKQVGKFIGRIWVEDRENAIVRFNGTYVQPPTPKATLTEGYFHFDSWRVNTGGSEWIPEQIYVEEEAVPGKTPATSRPRFKAQTRIWDYAAAPADKLAELTSILVEKTPTVKDQDPAKDLMPLESQRLWERQAEENILARLEAAGLLASAGPVDEVLNTVVNNLIVSANLNVEARCRVLLTTPLETFSVGHTIVISRGLIDVLPDETSLALVLADELSHIVLGSRMQTEFAFNDRTMFKDIELLQRLHFSRSKEEMLKAAKKTIEIMRASPYTNTTNAGLFLKVLASRGPALPRLLQANLGNQVANAESLTQLAAFAGPAPALEEQKLEQIAALPLGSRIKLYPWNNRIELIKTRPIALLSPREKMPFEIAPCVLYLTRAEMQSPSDVPASSSR